MAPGLLLVDDDSAALLSLARALRGVLPELRIEAATSCEKALELAEALLPEAAVIDLNIDPARGVESGFELLKVLLRSNQACRVIVLTGHGSLEHGVRALTLGAASFVEKPADIAHLSELVRDGVKQSQLRRAYSALVREQAGSQLQTSIVGSSSKTLALREAIGFAAQTTQAVLLSGETGTGKGLCAYAIHQLSACSQGKFVRYQPNFAAADLVSSELFGHVKGAFTGAAQERRGLVAEADGGTLFLDEVDELPAAVQVSLLGVLQDGKFRAVGADREQRSQFRLVCATNRPIEECLSCGKLRHDFFHRIAHLRIDLPPLRERAGDIPELAAFFLSKLRERDGLNVFDISSAALAALAMQQWPGNIRELEAVLEAAAFRARFAGRSMLAAEDLGLQGDSSSTTGQEFNARVNAFKLKLIADSLARNDGNQVKAAAELGLDRSTMRRILERNS